MKNLLDRLNSRLEMSEERFSELEDRAIEIIHSKNIEEKDWGVGRNGQNLSDL